MRSCHDACRWSVGTMMVPHHGSVHNFDLEILSLAPSARLFVTANKDDPKRPHEDVIAVLKFQFGSRPRVRDPNWNGSHRAFQLLRRPPHVSTLMRQPLPPVARVPHEYEHGHSIHHERTGLVGRSSLTPLFTIRRRRLIPSFEQVTAREPTVTPMSSAISSRLFPRSTRLLIC